MHVDNEGYLVARRKGARQEEIPPFPCLTIWRETVDAAATETVFIGHCDAKEDAEFVASLVHEKYPDMLIHIDTIGTSIGAHSGPGNHRALLRRQRALRHPLLHPGGFIPPVFSFRRAYVLLVKYAESF